MSRGQSAQNRLLTGGGLAALALAAACGNAPPRTAPAPEPTPKHAPPPAVPAPHPSVSRTPLPPSNPNLPPVPSVMGPLDIKVVYPSRNALIASRDSNFIFGSLGNGAAGLEINGNPVPVWPNGAFMGWIPNPPADSQWYDLEAYTLADTVRLRYPVRTRSGVAAERRAKGRVEPARLPEITKLEPAIVATLRNDSLDRAVSDTDNIIIGRPTPTGDYKWFLLPGTRVRALEYRDDMARVQLDGGQDIWVSRRDVKPSARSNMPALKLNDALMSASSTAVQFDFHIETPPAYVVGEEDSALTLTFYNVSGSAKLAPIPDSLISDVTQSQQTSRTVFHIALTRPLYGYQVLYENGVFKFIVRRPPVVDAAAPLRGMTIVVDPGHPPIGATGPTGLWEPVATLAVGLRIQLLLEEKGAKVVMTRTTAAPVALGDRPIIARRANADAFVSIHLNAVADGQDPFRDNGTGTYYFHPQSKLFARDIQDALVPELGLHDRGIFYQNLAVCRPTWFPSVLAEGVFIIMPDQEAAIRTPEYQEAYARGIVNGLEKYFATFARSKP
ncbi:MAG: N-acetylmuramoyl-L-alanine amidase [Gemmatimonadaceae bacterium]